MVLGLSLGGLYGELIEDPDLRRLGPYKIIAEDKQAVIPIDLDCSGQDIYLGEGDFTDGLVAFCKTKAASLDFGNARFTDLYLDDLDIGNVNFEQSEASRLYFDYAKIKDCHFGDFTAGEIYLDVATIEDTFGENLRAGIVYVEASMAKNFDRDNFAPYAHRITVDGDETVPPRDEQLGAEVKTLSEDEFLSCLREDSDLRRLGKYRVVPVDANQELRVDVDLEDAEINFGEGDFTAFGVSFGATRAKAVDFATSKFGDVDMRDAKIQSCFFAEFNGRTLKFGDAEIANVFCETGTAQVVYLENLQAGQFNVNRLATPELRLGRSKVREMFLSRGDGITNMYGELADIQLLNLHEGKLNELDFGRSRIRQALINKASIQTVKAEGLVADKLYIGNYENEIGKLELGLSLGVTHLAIDEAFPLHDTEGRRVIGEVTTEFTPPPKEITRG